MSVNRARALAVLVVIVLPALAFASHCARAQPARPLTPPIPDKELVVGTKEAPPFAMKQADGSWHGISIDLWRRIADRLHLRYRFSEQPTVQALVQETADGSLDAAIAALTVTAARERVVDFTHPFYTTGLGVAVSLSESRWMSIFRALSSFGFFQAVLALLGIALCVGLVIWLLERRKTEHFGGGAKGLGTGVWWSTIAMTQAGAAQNAPATLPGRVVAAGWMIASVIAIAVFTAGITSTLTKRELQGTVHSENDLRFVRVGAIAGSASLEYLDHHRISYSRFATAGSIAGIASGQARRLRLRQAVAHLARPSRFLDDAAGAGYRFRQSELCDCASHRQPAARAAQRSAAGGNRERLVGSNAVPVSRQEVIRPGIPASTR
jgi:polar amino acid transport system substrate-binding protein